MLVSMLALVDISETQCINVSDIMPLILHTYRGA